MDEEYKDTTGKVIDVHTEIEKPHVLIVARCRSCDAEQLAHISNTCHCLQHPQKNLKTADGVEIRDKMRLLPLGRSLYCGSHVSHNALVFSISSFF